MARKTTAHGLAVGEPPNAGYGVLG
jgi:hypothetical protein